MKKLFAILLAVAMLFTFGCGNKSDKAADANVDKKDNAESTESVDYSNVKVGMVTDEGGVNDQSFNQSGWEGLQQLGKDTKINVSYVESHIPSDYAPNFQAMLEAENGLIWGVGFKLEKDLTAAAAANPDTKYALIDSVSSNPDLKNVVNCLFKDNEPSFLVGYIAGKMTETNKVGFVGGIEGDTIWAFEYGYRAGVQYAAKELGKDIEVEVQYADSFTDATKGKAIAKKMYEGGADIVFHAAGGVGDGVIEAAREADKKVIGVDRDQNYIAPDHVITSTIKNVGVAMYDISKEFAEGKFEAKTVEFSLANNGVDIAPTSDKHVPADVLEEVEKLKENIVNGDIKVPNNEESYEEYIKSL